MDARSLSEVTGVQVGTLNAWVQRGLFPGVTADARGRLRDFDFKTARHVAVVVQLMQFGISAPVASSLAILSFLSGGKLALVAKNPTRTVGERNFQRVGQVTAVGFESEADLSKALAELAAAGKDWDEQPLTYIVINIEALDAKIRRAEEEYRQRGKIVGARTRIRERRQDFVRRHQSKPEC